MPEPYRVAVLGLTHDHVWHNLPHLANSDRGELIAAADANAPLRERAEGEYGCTAYENAEQLVERERPDAVYVFADNAGGADLAAWALDRGLHVLIEKPMAADLAGAERMAEAAERSGTRLMINWPFAWWPQLQRALALAYEGAIGELWQVRYRAAHAGPREMGCSEYFCDWLFDPKRNGAGGALMDYCCYGANLARNLLGMPGRVTGLAERLCKTDIDVADNAIVTMIYDGALSTAEASWTQIGKLTAYITALYGSAGTLMVEPRHGGRLFKATDDDQAGSEIEVPEPAPHMTNSAEHFLHGIATGEPFFELCRPDRCRDVQEILEAGARAAESRQEVGVPIRSG
jgi:predicted dehydrogenase